jgi:hypothetical protein
VFRADLFEKALRLRNETLTQHETEIQPDTELVLA